MTASNFKVLGLALLAALPLTPFHSRAQTAQVVLLGRSAGFQNTTVPWQDQTIVVARNVSPNGSFMAGVYSRRLGPSGGQPGPVQSDPAIWSWSNGLEVLPNLGFTPSNLNFGWAAGVTDDGSRAMGSVRYSDLLFRAFSWSRDGGLLQLPMPAGTPEDLSANIVDCTPDCARGIGHTYTAFGSPGPNDDAVIWSNDGAIAQPLLPHFGYAISADGATFAGQDGALQQSWLWRPSDPLPFFLTEPPTGTGHDVPTAISDDGLVVVGTLQSNEWDPTFSYQYTHAYRWTQQTGMIDLGDAPCPGNISVDSVNHDGSVILGSVNCTVANGGRHGLVWILGLGWQELAPMLASDYQLTFPDINQVVASTLSPSAPVFMVTGNTTPIGTSTVSAASARYAVRLPAECLPVIDQQPLPISVHTGDTFTLSTTAHHTGPSPLGYQWFRNDLPLDDSNSQGANSPTLTISNATDQDAGLYTVAVTTICGSTTSAQVAVTVRPRCGTADFNGDGDAGTDSDIESFFACIAGSCCASCGSPDFNSDGDVGTDSDIESFFRVLAGGPC